MSATRFQRESGKKTTAQRLVAFFALNGLGSNLARFYFFLLSK